MAARFWPAAAVFPTFEQGVACFTSKEYDEAAAFRRTGAGEVETIIVDGGDATK